MGETGERGKKELQAASERVQSLLHCALSILNTIADRGCDEASSVALSMDPRFDVNETLMALVTIFSSRT